MSIIEPQPCTPGGGEGFDGVHNDLLGRSTASAHPISAITGLQTALDGLESFDEGVDSLFLEAPLTFDPAPPDGTQGIRARGVPVLLAVLPAATIDGSVVGITETILSTVPYTIPANTLHTGDILRVRSKGTYLKNSGVTGTTWRIRIGANVNALTSAVPSLTNSASVHHWSWDAEFVVTATPGLSGRGIIHVADTGTVTDNFVKVGRSAGATNIGSLATALDLRVTGQLTAADATQNIVCDYVIIEHVRAA